MAKHRVPKDHRPPALQFWHDGQHPLIRDLQVSQEGLYKVKSFRSPRLGEWFWSLSGYPMKIRNIPEVLIQLTNRVILEKLK